MLGGLLRLWCWRTCFALFLTFLKRNDFLDEYAIQLKESGDALRFERN